MTDDEKTADGIREQVRQTARESIVSEAVQEYRERTARKMLYDGRFRLEELADLVSLPQEQVQDLATGVQADMTELIYEFRGYEREVDHLSDEERTPEILKNIYLNIICVLNRLLYCRDVTQRELKDFSLQVYPKTDEIISLIKSFYISGSNFELLAHAQRRLEHLYTMQTHLIYEKRICSDWRP